MLSLRSVTTGGAFRAAPSRAHEKTPTGGPCTPGAGRWCPEENASFLSRLLFLYVGGLVRMGYLKTLHQEDLWDVAVQVCMGYILGWPLRFILRYILELHGGPTDPGLSFVQSLWDAAAPVGGWVAVRGGAD